MGLPGRTLVMMQRPNDTEPCWLDDWAHGPALPPPAAWGRPGLALLFNLTCAGCVSRTVPWLKRASVAVGSRATLFAVHTAYGHQTLPRTSVAPQVERFARSFALLPCAVALDASGDFAERLGAEGTPHWLIWNERGALERSIYGSQANARTRLEYILEAWGVTLDGSDSAADDGREEGVG